MRQADIRHPFKFWYPHKFSSSPIQSPCICQIRSLRIRRLTRRLCKIEWKVNQVVHFAVSTIQGASTNAAATCTGAVSSMALFIAASAVMSTAATTLGACLFQPFSEIPLQVAPVVFISSCEDPSIHIFMQSPDPVVMSTVFILQPLQHSFTCLKLYFFKFKNSVYTM